MFATLAKLAHGDGSVLVTGEPGTGKSATARALHDASPRADKPFVVVECAAFAAALLDAELFGHVAEEKLGAIEDAEGGTLLLDDVSELPLPLQQKLAKVLEAKTTQRIGEAGPPEEARTFDVRLVATSSRDLRVMVNRGSFREDLYLRLAGASVSVPPLRDRMADLPLLELVAPRLAGASEKGAKISSSSGSDVRTMDITHRGIAGAGATPDGSDPNVGARRGSSEGSSEEPLPASLEPWFGAGYKDFREKWQDLGEREYLKRLMLRTGRISSVASRESGLDRTYLYRLLKKHGV
jgi:DNA-binding NtrC family response regulator